MKPQIIRKRPKSPSIQNITESAPWVLLSKAAEESGLTELQIRQAKFETKKFGNADFVRPTDVNAWILRSEKVGSQVKPEDYVAEPSAAIRPQRQFADKAMDDFVAALPILSEALVSGQSAKVVTLLGSCWSGELCDNLASLDPKVVDAIIAMIAARAHCGRDADLLLRHLISRQERLA